MKTFKQFNEELCEDIDYEVLDELNKKTLDNYVQKAIDSHGHANYERRVASGADKERATRITNNRKKGITRATYKLDKINANEDINEATNQPKHYLVDKDGRNIHHDLHASFKTVPLHFDDKASAINYKVKGRHLRHIHRSRVVFGTSDKHGFITPTKE